MVFNDNLLIFHFFLEFSRFGSLGYPVHWSENRFICCNLLSVEHRRCIIDASSLNWQYLCHIVTVTFLRHASILMSTILVNYFKIALNKPAID